MRRNILSVFLCFTLLLACVLPASALGTGREIEIPTPEQKPPLTEVVAEKEVADPITRSELLTLLGSAAQVLPPVDYLPYLFDDADPLDPAAPYWSWALLNGLVSGTGERSFQPEGSVTREQLAAILYRYLSAFRLELPEEEGCHGIIGYADGLSVSTWAFAGVDLLSRAGILSGTENVFGGEYFLPGQVVGREECMEILNRLEAAAQPCWETAASVENLVLNVDALELEGGERCALSAIVFPLDAEAPSILWYSTDPAVAVDAAGNLEGMGIGTAEVHAMTASGLDVCCTVTCLSEPPVPEEPEEEPAEEPLIDPEPSVYVPASYNEKCRMVFGEVLDDPRLAYAGDEEAKPHMVCIPIQAWDLDENGEKYTRTFYLEVHENIVDIVKAVFEEIYALPEQPVIHSIGGYRWDGKCEHSVGLAIDINPMENYYCDPEGNAVVGKYFHPGEDPYSIPVGGSVDQIFAKYGFTRGIYWRSGYKDYMHYSFFGS